MGIVLPMRLLSLLALVVLLALPAGTQAQAPAQNQTMADAGQPSGQSRYLAEEDRAIDQQSAFLHFATQYTEAIVVGLLSGGLAMNQLVGGLPATLAGTVAGALLSSWLFLDQASNTYVVRQIHQ